MSTFQLSDDVLEQYRRLQYDSEATFEGNILPIATIYWPDEHPDGRLPMDVDEESKSSILRLVSARTSLWSGGEIPEHLKAVWEEATKLIPNWPGFQRLALTDEQKEAAERYFESAADFLGGFFAGADQVRLEQVDGLTLWSAGVDLNDDSEALDD